MTPDEIFATPLQYGAKPFNCLHWKLWQENFHLPLSPAEERQESRALAKIKNPEMDDKAYDKLVPLDEAKFTRETQVFETWVSKKRQYSSKNLYKLSKLQANFKRWAEQKQVPEMLDIEEYCYMVRFLNALAKRKRIPEPSLKQYSHPAEPGSYKRVTSKVGRVYGTWQLTALVSETEHAHYSTFYRAKCVICGHVIEKFSYSRLGQKCGSCLRLAKPASNKEIEVDKEGYLKAKLVIWQVPGGVLVQPDQPPDATACATQFKLGEAAPWVLLEVNREPIARPKEPSRIDTKILTLLDDMPGM